MVKLVAVEGAKGGGKKGGKSPQSAANTLRSRATVRLTYLLGEGEIELVDNILVDGTPWRAQDGTINFPGIKWDWRSGMPDQEPFPGAPFSETPYIVERAVEKKNGQVVRTITDANADSVRVIIRIDALYTVNKKDGTLQPNHLGYHVKIRPNGGQYYVAHAEALANQKCVAPVQLSHLITLPANGFPWDIAVERITPDPTDPEASAASMTFETYTTVVEGKFAYPNSALAFVEIDAEQFGSSQPTITFTGRWQKTPVPTNYNPVEKTYGEFWNGEFVYAWHSNPAWVLYDLITNDRYGIGEFVDPARIDKMSFYTIAKYCDQKIPSGFKDEAGQDILEPRFSFHGSINTRQEAFELLNAVANCFRGQTYWSLGQVFAVADMPADARRLLTPANVHEGTFEYAGVDETATHSVAVVGWNDPGDNAARATELVINDDTLERFGWRETELSLMGVQSRGQAYRLGRWVLDTEQHENETVMYGASYDHLDLKPYDIVKIADPRKADFRMGGLVRVANGRTITLDAPFDVAAGVTHFFTATLPTGDLEKIEIERFNDLSNGTATVLTLAKMPSQALDVNSVWQISSVNTEPKQYRVLAIQEESKGFFKITALFHDPNKYARVEYNIILDPIRYTRPKRTIKPPTNLQATETKFFEAGVPRSVLTLSWTPGDDFMSSRYFVTGETPRGHEEWGTTSATTYDITNLTPGRYELSVIAQGYSGLSSEPATVGIDITGWNGESAPAVIDLRLLDGGTEFAGNAPTFLWTPQFAGGPSSPSNPLHAYTIVKIFDNRVQPAKLLREERISSDRYTYTYESNVADNGSGTPARKLSIEVTIVDTYDRPSLPATLAVENPAPGVPTVSVTAGFEQIFVVWRDTADLDLAGAVVHVSKISGFVPGPETIVFKGKGNAHNVPAFEYVEHFVRVGLYDGFSDVPENYSSEILVIPLRSNVDLEPPAMPTGLEITSELLDNGMAIVFFDWDANTEDDMFSYRLLIAVNGGNETAIPVGGNHYEATFLPGTRLVVRLNAQDLSQNISITTQPVEHVVARDKVPPATPTNIETRASFKAIWLDWDYATETDFKEYRIFVNDTGIEPADDEESYYVTGANSFAVQGLPSNHQFYFWLEAVDTSGNRSPRSEVVTETTVGLQEGDTGLYAPVAVDRVPVPPLRPDAPLKIYDRSTRKFYDLKDGEYVEENDARLLTGALDGALLTALSVAADKIGRGAITRTKIGNRQIRSPKIASNAVTTKQLAAGSVTAEEIQAGSIETFHILAQAIVAEHLSANIISAAQLKAEKLITLSAQIADAIIDDAKIVDLSAAKLRAGTALAETITVTGRAMRDIKLDAETGAKDPARRINEAVTLIEPGRIKLTGTNQTLSTWIMGDGSSDINGDRISTGSIKANAVEIGMRALNIAGVEFEHNKPNANQVSWTAGTIQYTDDDGATKSTAISAGSATFSSGTLYLYWRKGSSAINASPTLSTAMARDCVVLAAYRGGTDLVAQYGRTIIDGGKIKTQTIQADAIGSNAIQSRTIAAGAITGGHIQADTIDARLAIKAGTIDATKLTARGITSDQIQLGTITGNLIADAAIGSGKLAGGVVTADKLADASVGATKIIDKSIWADHKLAVDSITGTLIRENSISTRNIVAGAINAGKIAANAIQAEHISASTINADKIVANSIETRNVQGGAISGVAAGFANGRRIDLGVGTNGGTTALQFSVAAEHFGSHTHEVQLFANGALIHANKVRTQRYQNLVRQSGGEYLQGPDIIAGESTFMYVHGPGVGWTTYTVIGGSGVYYVTLLVITLKR